MNRAINGTYKPFTSDAPRQPRNARRSADNALLDAEQRKLKGAMRESCICAALAIEAVRVGDVSKARVMGMLAMRNAKLGVM